MPVNYTTTVATSRLVAVRARLTPARPGLPDADERHDDTGQRAAGQPGRRPRGKVLTVVTTPKVGTAVAAGAANAAKLTNAAGTTVADGLTVGTSGSRRRQPE